MKRLFLLILLTILVIDIDSASNKTTSKTRGVNSKRRQLNNALEKVLKLRVELTDIYHPIGKIYQTEKKKYIFVKDNTNRGFKKKYRGEYESLKAIDDTDTLLVPSPLGYGETDSDEKIYFVVMDFMNLTLLNNKSTERLGDLLADMHLYNIAHDTIKKPSIKKFGFHVETSRGFIPQNNSWTDDWITFFIEKLMTNQMMVLQSSPHTSPEKTEIISNYWPQLKRIIPKFFDGIEVKPSLLHGDLWTGNVGHWHGKPVLVDPASFYGHHEFDLASTTLHGGYLPIFYDTYFKKIPKANGFENREKLYHLFSYLNHWNHYGGCQDLTLKIFKKLLNIKDSK